MAFVCIELMCLLNACARLVICGQCIHLYSFTPVSDRVNIAAQSDGVKTLNAFWSGSLVDAGDVSGFLTDVVDNIDGKLAGSTAKFLNTAGAIEDCRPSSSKENWGTAAVAAATASETGSFSC